MKTDKSRRATLRSLGVGGVALAGNSLAPRMVQAAGSGEFRALVCVFLYGGNDGVNMVPPVAGPAWSRYSAVRAGLALSAADVIDLNGEIGMHQAMSPLKAMWDNGTLAVINNVGALSRPTSQSEFLDWRTAPDNEFLPDNLFSHSDQQVLWQAGHADAMTRTGWGGRLMEALGAQSPVYTFGRSGSRFGEGELTQQLSLPPAGSQLGLQGFGNDSRWANARLKALQELAAQGNTSQLQNSFSHSQFSAFETSNLLGDMLAQAPVAGVADAANPEISAAFSHFAGAADNPLSHQLYQVAKMIKHRGAIGGNRHMYFVGLEDFDHHAGQLDKHGPLLASLATALAGFQQVMETLGVARQVTLFTESDFGRTFKPNRSGGTDHGWGNQQLVLGGAVHGGRTHGVYPSLELGGQDDSGGHAWEHQGRWIPGTSIEQYAATLANWFAPELGISVNTVLPNLHRFERHDLAFIT